MGTLLNYATCFVVGLGLTQCSTLYGQIGSQHRSILSPPRQPVTAESPIETAATTVEQSADTLADPDAPLEIVQERYTDGSVKVEREVTLDTLGNYIFHGDWTMYSRSGEEIAHGRFQNDKREGEWTRTYARADAPLFSEEPYRDFTEPFMSVATFKNGKLNGTWTIYDHEQRVVCEWEYTDGERHGIRRWNYPSGEIRQEITYKHGLVDGKHRGWDEENQLTIDDNYQNGRKLALRVEHYSNGQKKSEGMYLHQKLVPERPEDWWTANTGTYVRVGDIERHGQCTSWHENGHKKCEETFEHEKPVGKYSWWHPNSQLGVSGHYDDGERHGPWVWWHPNGQKATHGHYLNGELTGKWSYWTVSGVLKHKIDYTGESRPVELHVDSEPQEDEVAERQVDSDKR